MDPVFSADVNIQRMCFTPEGMLFKEFDLIFHDLFSRRDTVYREIVAALVNGPLDLEGLYAALGVGKSGKISEYTTDLVQAGFLSRDYTWDLKTADEGKQSKLRLSDNYLRFYLKYVQPNHRRIERGTLSRLPNIDGILGLQFENIVLKNRLALFERLHIDPNDVLYDNPFFQRKTLRQAGCQIDYLIQVRQKTLYVCEIKFSRNALAPSVISEVQAKIQRLSMPRHMSYRPVLLHAGAIAESIAEQDYFSSVIDFGEMLTSANGDKSGIRASSS